MSKRETKEYILNYDSIDLKGWDPKINTRPSQISTFNYFQNLKEAFNSLASLDKRYFNEALSVKENLSQVITKAYILDTEGNILIMCRYSEGQKNNMMDGLFIELNSKRITQSEFEKATGYSLGDLVHKGPLLDYYLFDKGKSVQLTRDQLELRRHIHNGPRQVKKDDLGGPKL